MGFLDNNPISIEKQGRSTSQVAPRMSLGPKPDAIDQSLETQDSILADGFCIAGDERCVIHANQDAAFARMSGQTLMASSARANAAVEAERAA